MNPTHLQGRIPHWIHKALPWACVLGLSMSIAYAMNTTTVAALSPGQPFQATLGAAGDAIPPCTLDADGALYAGWEWWLPAGKNAFCRGQTYPGVGGRDEMEAQLTRAGRLLASISFVAASDIRVDLYCPTGSTQRSFDAEFVAAAEVRDLYKQICTPGY